MTKWAAAERALMRLAPGRRRGRSWLGRMGDLAQQPPVWAGLAAALALGDGARGRRAALRGAVCYGLSAVVANAVVKPFVARRRPPGAGRGRPGPVTSSFPSGHAATDLAFSIGVAQEIPALFLPLALATSTAHWSLVRSRGHYPTDVLAGGVIGVAVGLAAWRLWPSGPGRSPAQGHEPRPEPAQEATAIRHPDAAETA